MSVGDKIEAAAAAAGGARERVEAFRDQAVLIRREAPTLTTALLVAVLLIGCAIGAWVDAFFTTRRVNAEWRQRIAQASARVEAVVKTGNADSEAIDADVIKQIEVTDAKLDEALRKLAEIQKSKPADRCSVPADCVHE